MSQSNRIFYGSGNIYSVTYNSATFPTVADMSAMTDAEALAIKTYITTNAVAANQIGYLKGGVDCQITTETLTDQSDLGEMKIDTIKKETGAMTFALFNANLETIGMQYPTARYKKNTTNNIEVVMVGGLNNLDTTTHVLIFEQLDSVNGNLYCICVGKNTSGFDIKSTPDGVTPFQCNFTMQPFGSNGDFYMMVGVNPTTTTSSD